MPLLSDETTADFSPAAPLIVLCRSVHSQGQNAIRTNLDGDSEQPLSAAVRIARLVGHVKGFLTSLTWSWAVALSRRRKSPVYSSTGTQLSRERQHSRSLSIHETGHWNYRLTTAL